MSLTQYHLKYNFSQYILECIKVKRQANEELAGHAVVVKKNINVHYSMKKRIKQRRYRAGRQPQNNKKKK